MIVGKHVAKVLSAGEGCTSKDEAHEAIVDGTTQAPPSTSMIQPASMKVTKVVFRIGSEGDTRTLRATS
jgi:hypothetical protein